MKSYQEDVGRVRAYYGALRDLASDDEFKTSHRRFVGFEWMPRWQQIKYIEWINEQAPTTPWCAEIVAAFAARQLGLD